MRRMHDRIDTDTAATRRLGEKLSPLPLAFGKAPAITHHLRLAAPEGARFCLRHRGSIIGVDVQSLRNRLAIVRIEGGLRSEEQPFALQSRMSISYSGVC